MTKVSISTEKTAEFPNIQDVAMQNFAQRTVLSVAQFFADENLDDVLALLRSCNTKTERNAELQKKVKTFMQDLDRLNRVSERKNKELTGERIAVLNRPYRAAF